MEKTKSIEVNIEENQPVTVSVSISIRDEFIGLLTIVFISFIILKLCHVINLPWIWVLSPLWILLTLVIIIKTVLTYKADVNIESR